MRWIAALLLPAVLLLAAACGDEGEDAEPTATVTVEVAATTNTPAPPGPTDTPAPPEATNTEPPAEPTATPVPPEPTDTPIPPLTNRRDCEAIRGTAYLSPGERDWFLSNCLTPTATLIPTATSTGCGAPQNPWGYDFCPGGTRIYSPPSDFCSYFACIGNFWNGRGYVIQCRDGMFGKSGGIQGSCSYHGGNRRPLLSY